MAVLNENMRNIFIKTLHQKINFDAGGMYHCSNNYAGEMNCWSHIKKAINTGFAKDKFITKVVVGSIHACAVIRNKNIFVGFKKT